MQKKSGLPAWVLAVAAVGCASSAGAASIEVKTALQQLLTTLPGEYDSEPQRFFEAEYKTPESEQHGRIHRVFTRIEAPAVGPNVLVSVGHTGSEDGVLDERELLVWTLEMDDAKRAVRMSPWQFRNPADYAAIATDADKLKGLTPAALEPAVAASACPMLWQLLNGQLRGRTSGDGCRTAAGSGQRAQTFGREWLLNEDELWINVAGRDAKGKILTGRQDQTHWRLGKARSFECFFSYRPAGGAAVQSKNGFRMHDRGDVFRFELGEGAAAQPAFIELIRGVWPSNSGRNYMDLLRMRVYAGRPEDPEVSLRLIGNSIGSAATDRVGFASETLSARCKLIGQTIQEYPR